MNEHTPAAPLSILEIGGGALVEEINHQAKRIAENLLDPNTSYKDARKLKIEMVFKQDENRQQVEVMSKVSASLAISKPLTASLAFAFRAGEVEAVELVSNPGQINIWGKETPQGLVIPLGRAEKTKEVAHD